MTVHRRSFAKTTILAICVLVVLLVSMATSPFLLRWLADDHSPGWGLALALVLSTVVLMLLSAFAALVAVGGMIVLYRDSCEERGVPYSPTRPRERNIG